MPDITAQGVILCDEVRQEANGKYIILGVYSGGVSVQSMPARLNVALYLMLKFEKAGPQSLVIEIGCTNTRARMGIQVDILDPRLVMAIPTPPVPLVLTDTEDLVVSLGLEDEELVEASRIGVQVNPEIWTMYPNAQRPPDEQSPTDEQG